MRLTRQQCDRLQRDHMILSHAQFPSIPMKAGKAVRTMTKRTTSTASLGRISQMHDSGLPLALKHCSWQGALPLCRGSFALLRLGK